MAAKRIGRRKAGLVVLVVLLAGMFAGSWAYGSWAVRRAEAQFPPEGRFVAVEGVRLHYVCKGEGRPVVLLHGNAGFVRDYSTAVLDRLAQDYRACAFDRPGHGYSERPAGGEAATPAAQAHLIHEASRELGMEEPVLVGHSWSGALGLAYALEYPDDVSGLVLLGPVAYGREGRSSPLYEALATPVLGDLIQHTIGVGVGPGIVEQSLVEAFSPNPVPPDYLRAARALWTRPGQQEATAEDSLAAGPAMEAMSPRYGEIRVPVTIVTGDSDRLVDPEQHSYPLHEAIRGSKLVVLPDAGHDVQHTRPKETVDAIRETPERAGSLRRPDRGALGRRRGQGRNRPNAGVDRGVSLQPPGVRGGP